MGAFEKSRAPPCLQPDPVPWAHLMDQLGSPVREAGTDLARRKLNSLGNYPIYEALKWSFQSTGARCLHGPILRGTASAGASTMTSLGSALIPSQRGSAPAESSPLVLPADRRHAGEQQIYREKVSKQGLEVLHATETKPTLMPEFLLPSQTTLVLLYTETPHPKRVPAGSRDWDPKAEEKARPHTGDLTRCLAVRDAAYSPRPASLCRAIPMPHVPAPAWQRPARHPAVPAAVRALDGAMPR